MTQLLTSQAPFKTTSGIAELDTILYGGFVTGRCYLVRGGPGSGKTTVGLHFLTAAAPGERTMYITTDESEAQIRQNAAATGFNLEDVYFVDLTPTSDALREMQNYTIFSPSEVELEPILERIVATVEEVAPQRVFLDAMTQFRYLAPDPFQHRKQVLSLLRFLGSRGATVLLTSEDTPTFPDDDLQFMCDGVIQLDTSTGTFKRRSLEVRKFRSSSFRAGQHAMRLTGQGLRVYPRLQPDTHQRDFPLAPKASGVPELDRMLMGGLENGTVTIISGPTGVGKTTLGLQFMKEAAGRGERSVVYAFDEMHRTLVGRAEQINLPLRAMLERGTLSIRHVEPLTLMPEEFALMVRRDVEENEASIVMIDSIQGYHLSLDGDDLVSHLHALSKYLKNMGTTAILIDETSGVIGEFRATQYDISYLTDNIVFLSYLEMHGELRRAIGVLKKRLSNFEKSLRAFEFTPYGISVGQPLTKLRGILSGVPEIVEPPGDSY